MNIQDYTQTVLQVKNEQQYVESLFSMMQLQLTKKIKESLLTEDVELLTILQDIKETYTIDTFLGSTKQDSLGRAMYQPTIAEMVLFFDLSFQNDESIVSSIVTHRMDDERMILFLSFPEYYTMSRVSRMNWLQDMLVLFRMEVTQQPQFVM